MPSNSFRKECHHTKRMLRSKLKVAGIAVPGMPSGSPGMEGSRGDPYDVLAFDRNGATRIHASYR